MNCKSNVKSTNRGTYRHTSRGEQHPPTAPRAERFKTDYVAPEKHSYLMRHEARKERFIQQRSGFATGSIDPFSEVRWCAQLYPAFPCMHVLAGGD